MEKKLKLVPAIYLYRGKILDIDSLEKGAQESAAAGTQNSREEGRADDGVDYASRCAMLCHGGADELLVFDLSDEDEGHEENLARIKDIADIVDIPILAGGNVKRLEDVKKYIYAGASRAILNMGVAANAAMIQEASARFGKDRIAVYSARTPEREEAENWAKQGAELLILDETGSCEPQADERKDGDPAISESRSRFPECLKGTGLSVLRMSNLTPEQFIANYRPASALPSEKETEELRGVSLAVFRNTAVPLMQYKRQFADAGFDVFLLESPIPFREFKTNSDGLIPVIVQDYQTNEVLMLAYMNEEAFNHTLACGRMTYYSRSRRELWEKGLTSGHFQYVKSLSVDCDDDTLLAKVFQVGAACHTGHRSCFYRDLVPGVDASNPLTVFEDVYRVITDRKEHPKEGSYTNYLFDKGIDKILKKVGEEATEVVIAAKNPDSKETVYEISDLLYHMMVLMAEKGISWKEVTTELARR